MGIEVASAKGCTILDQQGKSYLDLISGISVANMGHSHPRIVQAVQDQAGKYMHTMVYGEHIQSPQVQLARALTEALGEGFEQVYFVNSGSEAIEAAIKLAKRATGRFELVAFNLAYHGSTHGALSLMGSQQFSNGYLPLVPGVAHLPFNDIDALNEISCRHAAVIVEVIQAESGYLPADIEFLKALKKRCEQTQTLLIFDEIQTGYGRTGPLFAFQSAGLVPDMICMAKGMGGGMPLGAMATSKALMQHFTENPVLGHITTFGGHPVSCAASLAALQLWQEEIPKNRAQEIEARFRAQLVHIPNSHITGSGAMLALHLGDAQRMWNNVGKAWNQGLLIDWFLFNDQAFRISPPLVISDEEIDKATDILGNLLV